MRISLNTLESSVYLAVYFFYLRTQVADLNLVFNVLTDAIVVNNTYHQNSHNYHYKILIMREITPDYA